MLIIEVLFYIFGVITTIASIGLILIFLFVKPETLKEAGVKIGRLEKE